MDEITKQRDNYKNLYLDLKKRHNALLDCYSVHEEPDGHGGMKVNFDKVLAEYEDEWSAANAKIESMQNELAEASKKLKAAYRNVAEISSREAAMRRELWSHGIDPNAVLCEDMVYLEAKARRNATQ